jgi:hypothetical protein
MLWHNRSQNFASTWKSSSLLGATGLAGFGQVGALIFARERSAAIALPPKSQSPSGRAKADGTPQFLAKGL